MRIQWPDDKPKHLYDSRTDNHPILSSLWRISRILWSVRRRGNDSQACVIAYDTINACYTYIYVYISFFIIRKERARQDNWRVALLSRLVHFFNLIATFPKEMFLLRLYCEAWHNSQGKHYRNVHSSNIDSAVFSMEFQTRAESGSIVLTCCPIRQRVKLWNEMKWNHSLNTYDSRDGLSLATLNFYQWEALIFSFSIHD